MTSLQTTHAERTVEPPTTKLRNNKGESCTYNELMVQLGLPTLIGGDNIKIKNDDKDSLAEVSVNGFSSEQSPIGGFPGWVDVNQFSEGDMIFDDWCGGSEQSSDEEETCPCYLTWDQIRRHLRLDADSFRDDAPLDLTRYGIEPNPGPVTKITRPRKPKQQISKSKVAKALQQKILATKGNPSEAAGFIGSGGYLSDIISSIGSALSKPADKLESWLSDKFKSLVGNGDYGDDTHIGSLELDGNSMLKGTSPPKIQNKGQAFIVRHREYVTDIFSAVAFTNTNFPLNPAQTGSFPWLAQIAANFEEYQILGMIAEYKPLVSSVSPNSVGSVVFATEYNAQKPVFTSKIQMENYEYATSVCPNQQMFHALECAPSDTSLTHRYTRVGAVPSNTDVRLFDWGNFQVAVQGQATAGTAIGELWFSFEIAFYKPLFASGLGLNLLADHFKASGQYIAGTTLNTVTGITTMPGSLLGCTLSNAGSQVTVTFPSNIKVGTYLVALTAKPTANWSASVVWGGPTGAQNCALVALYSPVNNSVAGTTLIATQQPVCTNFVINVSAPGTTSAVFAIGDLSAAITNTVSFDVFVTQINGSIQT